MKIPYFLSLLSVLFFNSCASLTSAFSSSQAEYRIVRAREVKANNPCDSDSKAQHTEGQKCITSIQPIPVQRVSGQAVLGDVAVIVVYLGKGKPPIVKQDINSQALVNLMALAAQKAIDILLKP